MTTTQPFDLSTACAEAQARLQHSLNRSVAQHRMHLARRAAAMVFERGAPMPYFTLVPIEVVDFYQLKDGK